MSSTARVAGLAISRILSTARVAGLAISRVVTLRFAEKEVGGVYNPARDFLCMYL
jgi:hypothetical protein